MHVNAVIIDAYYLEYYLISGDSIILVEFYNLIMGDRVGIFRLVKRIFVDTSVLLRCYYEFVLPILEYCSSVWGSAAECHLQLL